jgi:hypothetical protein
MTLTPDRTRLIPTPRTPAHRGDAATEVTHCPSCRIRASGMAARVLAAEVEIPWLVLDPTITATVREERHCRRCVPAGPITEIACRICSGGPLLLGAIADDPLVRQWLQDHGWGHGPAGWFCPSCPAPPDIR